MEFLQDILPFLLFLGVLISRSRKNNKRTMNRRNPAPRMSPIPNKEDITKARGEEHKAPTVNPQIANKETLYNIINEEDELVDYIIKNRNDYENTINAPRVNTITVEDSSSTKQNISRLKFDKSNLVNSIIMAEVLGKPKALKDKSGKQ